ncbi:alpha/beta hydrolase [Zoogloea sp.]|uniref:alpha/beta hydrolase n=1 Tax=Zoogloea sp. TaxID=49181 RepID=UPI0025F7B334|nr:alpha/beta hydrolase [Zoogloea sp.]MCK6393176.1 alpha/beta hydrolase [Zoogloea sp.]
MSPRQLKIHSHPAPTPSGKPPLLFVHGAYTNALGWQLNFIPYLNARGFDCFALDLSGHGESEGRDQLDHFGLADYADDVARAVASLPAEPVLIGHSMGTLVVQLYLAKASAAGVALLAPVPPTGTGGSASRLALVQPDFFSELPKVIAGRPDEHTLRVMAEVYFSPDMPHQDVLQFMPMIQAESEHAVAEMVALPFMSVKRRPDIPALVMGGGEDAVFPASMLFFTALPWKARQVIIPRAGHMLMLDPQWQEAAAALADWLETLPTA